MRIATLLLAVTAPSLPGCATAANQTSGIALKSSPDEHAEFHSLSVKPNDKGLEVRGWASSKQAFVAGSVHIEALSGEMVVAEADVSWRRRVGGVRFSRIRAASSSFHFSKTLPLQSLSADAIRVSHGHRGHTDITREEETK